MRRQARRGLTTLRARLAGFNVGGAVAGASSSVGRLRGELSGFVGRRAELALIRKALGSARLVTLCGPGGIGKTRLAVRAAWEARRAFGDGVWLVELAGLGDPALLAAEVARAVGLLDPSAGWAVGTLSEHLAGRQVLLVLDNCEHLLDACAVLAGAVLRACPGVRILATSRQVLGVTGEVTFAVPPLSGVTGRRRSSWNTRRCGCSPSGAPRCCPASAAAGLAVACDLRLYWETRGHLTEGRRHMDALLALVRSPCPLRTRGLWAAGYLALTQGDAPAAGRLLEAALLAAEAQGDAEAIAYASQFLGRAVWFLGDPARGLALTEEALARHRAAGDWPGMVLTLVQLGIMRAFTGDPAAAVGLFQECAGSCQERGERWNRSYALWGLGLATWLLGDAERAGELERAALRIKREAGDQVGAALCIEALAWIAGSRRRPVRAAILLGAAASAWQTIPATLPPPMRPHHQATYTTASRVLGQDAFAAALAKGRALSPSRRVAAALEEPATAGPAAGGQDPGIRLTAREHQVAALVAEGLSNKEIAGRMVISPRTAETHVQHIMDKLGFTTRSQLGV